MAVQSYLPETSGGMVAAASFADAQAAAAAVDLLHDSGVRPEDISVIARDADTAALIARYRAWTPSRNQPSGRLAKLLGALPRPGRGLPKEIRRRYRRALGDRQVVLVVAAGGQPADTLRALLSQAGGDDVDAWWSKPLGIFAPPELAGPF